MDRIYYQAMTAGVEIQTLTLAMVQNADYKDCIKKATDPLMLDVLKEMAHLQATLHEVMNRQEYANVKGLPE